MLLLPQMLYEEFGLGLRVGRESMLILRRFIIINYRIAGNF